MRIKPHEFVLLVLSEYGGTIQGKTLLQKLTYFTALAVAPDLPQRLGYRAHYYGPYSDIVDDAVRRLESLGFVEESRTPCGMIGNKGFEVKHFDYELKEDGKAVAAGLKKRYGKESKVIRRIAMRIMEAESKVIRRIAMRIMEALGELDYVDLSIAAKAYFLLPQKGGPMTFEDIRKMAHTFSWTIDKTQLDKVVRLFKEMGFVETFRKENAGWTSRKS